MRTKLRGIVGRKLPDHVGLAFERYPPPCDPNDGYTIPGEAKGPWVEDVAKTSICQEYHRFLARWKCSLHLDGSRAVQVTTTSRLLVGHGLPSPTEVGMTVHHTWGVPIIPGSALKGILAHYVENTYGPHDEDPEAESIPRIPYQGVTWAGSRIVHGPGKIYRVLFGAPDAEQEDEDRPRQAGRGCIVFHDALYDPENRSEDPFCADVLTVHHKSYYDDQGQQSPNDWEDPTPVPFLTVKPCVRFLLALSGPPEWTNFAMKLLLDALKEWGVGGKGSSGYGRLAVIGDNPKLGALCSNKLLREMKNWLLENKKAFADQKSQLTAWESLWVPRLRTQPLAVRLEAMKLLGNVISSKKRASEIAAIEQNLCA